MTEVRFYHLQHKSQEQVLVALLGKAYEQGHSILVRLPNAQDLKRMDDYLWSAPPEGFLPHGASAKETPEKQPIFLTTEDENPNKADVLIICDGATSEKHTDFKLCCEIIDGHNQDSIAAARTRWKEYKDKGFDITYWQQEPSGAWQKKA